MRGPMRMLARRLARRIPDRLGRVLPDRLPRRLEALVTNAVIAGATLAGCARAAGPAIQHINLAETHVDAPFSDAVLVDNTLYMAGRLGLDADTRLPPEDPEAEARLLLSGFADVLAAAGMSMQDLVFVQVFCPDPALYDTWNRVYREFVPAPFPARAFIGSGPLLFGARFEMQAIAVRR